MEGLKLPSLSVCGIYAVIRVDTGDAYVGQSINIRKRWITHRQDFKKNRHASRHMQRVFNKHGADIFALMVLELCAASELVAREKAWIEKLKPIYNSCPVAGSCLGFKHSPATREKHRQRMMGNKFGKGNKDRRRHSPETIAKISARKRGKPSGRKGFRHSPESIALMSQNRKGIPSQFRGIPRSEDVKRKIRATKAASRLGVDQLEFAQ